MWVQESSFHFLDASAHDNLSETDLYPTKLFSVDMANRAVTSLAQDGNLNLTLRSALARPLVNGGAAIDHPVWRTATTA
jgi:hypothetical protein